jgi:hypothetical protein
MLDIFIFTDFFFSVLEIEPKGLGYARQVLYHSPTLYYLFPFYRDYKHGITVFLIFLIFSLPIMNNFSFAILLIVLYFVLFTYV